jgi:hypothetical protein
MQRECYDDLGGIRKEAAMPKFSRLHGGTEEKHEISQSG